MSTLNIKFDEKSQVRQFNAPVSVEVVDSDLQLIGRMKMRHQGQLEVDPGFYLIRARLPSGEASLSTATIQEDQPSVDVTLHTSFSSREWLAWQHFLGEVPKTSEPVDLLAFQGISVRVWEYLDEAWSTLSTEIWKGYTARAGQTAIIELNLASLPFRLRLVQIGGPSLSSRFVSIPPTRYQIQVLLRPSRIPTFLNSGLTVKVASMDQDAEALSHYLNSGNLEAANLIADEVTSQGDEFEGMGEISEEELAEDLLGNKLPNHFGAVVGGYYLLRTRNYDRLHQWPNNFANKVSWLPDAAVIHAWQLLRTEGAAGRDLARSRLLHAAQRGVPVMTEGLRLLIDGLEIFADNARAGNEPDEAVEEALERIRYYAAATDWNQRLTTFYGDRPDHPSSAPVTLNPIVDEQTLIMDLA